ncbi:MAG: N-methyl-D-aspartate receptor NMDAR2C subunit [Alphaproteobacteria bacterium]|nr:N-methyl-D-aspartate receptor NMDAR2C subunit [Alphaproteobacteria bacterium]
MGILERAWAQCFADLGAPLPPSHIFDELLARYREPHRAYHTTQHLEECFAWFAQARHLMQAPGETAFALFYHDAIYDTHASDNELKSAQLAVDVFEYAVRMDARAVGELILATKSHSAAGAGSEIKIMLDIDLSILGASPERFDEYENQVRREYAWVDESTFRVRRAAILRQFADGNRIYATDFFRERLEGAARSNLARSIAKLRP